MNANMMVKLSKTPLKCMDKMLSLKLNERDRQRLVHYYKKRFHNKFGKHIFLLADVKT